MITLSIAGATPQEVAEHVKGFFLQLLVSQQPVEAPPIVPAQEPPKEEAAPKQEAAEPQPKAERKPRGKKDDASKAEPKGDTAEKQAVPDIAEVRAALMNLAKAKGDDAVWNLLEKYKAKSASTVPEDKRAELIAEVEKECA